jgi:hypothetical protein
VPNRYSRTPDAFDDESEESGLMFAGHAAVALAGAEHEQHLRAGRSSRNLICRARGILMERHKPTADQGFGVLSGFSSSRTRKLVDIASKFAESESGAERESPPGFSHDADVAAHDLTVRSTWGQRCDAPPPRARARGRHTLCADAG